MNIKVAVAQTDPQLGNITHNLEQTIDFMRKASIEGARLIAFPECSLTGYCFTSKEEGLKYALSVDGEWLKKLSAAAEQYNIYVVVGFVENDGGQLYNSSFVIGPEGFQVKYRKVHIPETGIDPHVLPGDNPIQVIDTPIGKLGILICYDIRFPEQARILALQGADILVHITNLTRAATSQVDYLLPARANENHTFVISSDRVGLENGFHFLGRSSVFGVNGETLVQANETDETIIFATLDLSLARDKNVFFPPEKGKPLPHTNRLFETRRQELYQDIVK